MSATKVMDSNPSLAIGGALSGLVIAVLGLLAAFGVNVTEEQSGSIVALLVAALAFAPFVTSLLVRFKVYAPETVAKLVPPHEGAGAASGDLDTDEPGEHRRID